MLSLSYTSFCHGRAAVDTAFLLWGAVLFIYSKIVDGLFSLVVQEAHISVRSVQHHFQIKSSGLRP